MERATVLLADDHRIVAESLAGLLRGSADVVGIVDNGEALVDAARRLRPRVIVADMSMPVMSGLDALRRLRADGVDARFVFLTMHADAALAGEALRAGASGYLLKQGAGEELLAAIKDVLAGRVYVSPLIARAVIGALSHPAPPAERLTLRQRDVLRLLAGGKSMKEVAAALDLSPRTVESHKYEMMHVLGVQSNAELIRYALRHGLVPADDPDGCAV
jgi:DNA-binding NarL/FixJ family response regulator